MATRTIVTSQPDVACDICARRLLRGEQPDVFVDAGRRRIVCELCAPRAAFEGWMRETDGQSLALPPARARRGRSFLGRLLAAARPPGEPADAPLDERGGVFDAFAGTAASAPASTAAPVPAQAPAPVPAASFEQGQPDFLAGGATPALGLHAPLADTGALNGEASETSLAHPHIDAGYLQPALEVFNASEFPRRVAGVIRSLGAPLVTVRSAEHLASVVRIVVAWELCWYRYEVDLSEPQPEAQVIAQGSELAELAREDREGNASASDAGQLALAGL
jgi:hypothetical protein